MLIKVDVLLEKFEQAAAKDIPVDVHELVFMLF